MGIYRLSWEPVPRPAYYDWHRATVEANNAEIEKVRKMFWELA